MFRHLLMACAALACALPVAHAQSAYPDRVVKFVVPFATGGDTDIIAREIAAKLAEKHRYNIVVENKPGAGGLLGAEYMLQQPADGYTVLIISGSYLTSAVAGKPSFDAIGSIQPVIQFTQVPGVLAVGAGSRFKSMKDLVQAAKQSPGKVTYASSGVGSLSNLGGEWLADLAGVKFNHIPYKGVGAAVADLVGGQVDFMLSGYGSVRPLSQAGKLRPLAIAWPTRMPDAPDVPTFAELGLAEFQGAFWHGMVVSKSVPQAVVAKLNTDINDVLRDPALKARLAQDGVVPQGGSPEQFRTAIRNEYQRWQKIVTAKGIKAE